MLEWICNSTQYEQNQPYNEYYPLFFRLKENALIDDRRFFSFRIYCGYVSFSVFESNRLYKSFNITLLHAYNIFIYIQFYMRCF